MYTNFMSVNSGNPAPLKLRPYGAVEMRLLLLFFDPGTQFPGSEKITLCNTKKYKSQAAMNLNHYY